MQGHCFVDRVLLLSVEGAALNHVFSLAGADLVANAVSRVFIDFNKTCPPQKVKQTKQNLSLVLRKLTLVAH